MRTRVIPAQITTVEDKIVGNLNFTQAGLVMLPILYATLAYIFLPTAMSFSIYKAVSFMIVLIFCIFLSLRFKGMVVANWLVIILRYNLRPQFFVFNKNDITLRNLYLPSRKKQHSHKKHQNPLEPLTKSEIKKASFAEIVALDDLIVSYRVAKKGGLNVAFKKVET